MSPAANTPSHAFMCCNRERTGGYNVMVFMAEYRFTPRIKGNGKKLSTSISFGKRHKSRFKKQGGSGVCSRSLKPFTSLPGPQ